MCQDETRLGLKTITGRVITAAGVKPLGLSQWKRDNFYLYGVVEPLSGYSFFYDFSHLDGDCFQCFLELLSSDIGDDIAVIQLDQGSFHKAKSLNCPLEKPAQISKRPCGLVGLISLQSRVYV